MTGKPAAVIAVEIGARSTRAERLAFPLARDVVKAVALEYGACIRPVQLRKTNLDTSQVDQVMVPCGATLASVCPPCAERNKVLKWAQCQEGWHLEDEPLVDPHPPDDYQKWLIEKRADLQAERDQADAAGQDTTRINDLIEAVEDELAATGVRGNPDPGSKATGKPSPGGEKKRSLRHRSTRRREDVLDLPKRKISPHTVGKSYATPDGKVFRPSMFITLTCPSYGKVHDDGTAVDPDTYDYVSAARDALHFAALFDRFIQNLRRVAGYEIQYFATIEPQKRLAPHVHVATRGTFSRAELRQVLAATITRSGGRAPTRCGSTATGCRCGTRPGTATLTLPPASCSPLGMTLWTRSARTMLPGTWCGMAASSMAKACWPDPRTPPGASAI